ncbi:hypothetical protein GB882_01355 [Georgenia ruanii]|uniref:alpha-amylase n=2 Tax=Georgenia ruanii TaxID=348442 RepID=A0A7J9URQ8_9MICO|nr:hypothetical protein [Georgenia ruanii]
MLEPGAHAPAGHDAVVRVHLRNLANAPRDLVLTLLGLDAEWLPGPVRSGAVAPDETVTVELGVRVGAGAVPGSYPFALAIEAHEVGAARPMARTLVDGALEVDRPSEVVLTVEPAESRAVLSRTVNVVLSNSGEEPVPLEVKTTTERGLRMSVPDALTVPARGSVTVAAKLSVLRPQILGHNNRMAYTLTARGRQAPASFRGTLTARPLLGSTGLKIVAVVATLALWVAGLGLGVPWLSTQFSGDQGEVLAEAGHDPAGGDAAAESDGGEDDGAGATGTAADGVRIGGVVAGTDPAGVRVDIAPASVLDLQTVPTAQEAGAAQAGAAEGTTRAAGTAGGTSGADITLASGAGAEGPPSTGRGAGMLGMSVPLPIAATVDRKDPAGRGPTGKTPAGALPITRTEALDAARSTSTLEDGTWAFAGMSATTNYLITLSKPGYQTQRFLVSGAEAAAAALETELVAGAGRLAGTVTGPAGPAGGVDITITDGTTTVTTSSNTTGNVGAWAVDGLSTPATYLITASGAGLGAQAALVTLGAGGQERVDLTLSSSVTTLTGKVTGPDSLGAVGGLGGVTVTATDGTTTRTASTATGALAGTFVLADLPVPAAYTITVSADGYASQSRAMELTAGAAATADFRLGVSSGVVQGTVRTPNGTGLGGVGLTLSNGENTYKTMNASDKVGSFRLNGVAPGEYVLQAELFGHVTGFAPVKVEAGAAATADLVLTPIPNDGLEQTGRIQGRVSDATTNGQITCPSDVANEDCVITVSLSAQDGEDGTRRDITVTTAPDLEYTIPAADDTGLLPGLYTLTISAPGYESGTVNVQVPMGETVQANSVALYRSPSITGTISARLGSVPTKPGEGTCVLAVPVADTSGAADCVTGQDAPGNLICTVQTTAGTPIAPSDTVARCAPVQTDGSYTIEHLSAGVYQVSVETPEPGPEPGASKYLRVSPVQLTLEAGEVRRYDATLDRLGHLNLTVLRDSGNSVLEPANGALVTAKGTTEKSEATVVDGLASFTQLVAGEYTITADLGGPKNSLTVHISNNQEISRQLVLTSGVADFEGQLFADLGDSSPNPLKEMTIKLTGIVSYSGLVPIRREVTAITDKSGRFFIDTNGDGRYLTEAENDPPVTAFALISDQISIHVPAQDGYKAYTQTGISISNLGAIEIEPAGQQFTGNITAEPADPHLDYSTVDFVVQHAPVAAANARLEATKNGRLVWRDPLRQAADDTAPASGTLIRPGHYTVVATLSGYSPITFPIVVDVGVKPPSVNIALPKIASISVAVFEVATDENPGVVIGSIDGRTKVKNPVVTLTPPAGIAISPPAELGSNTVHFGRLAPGEGYRLRIQAAGYAFYTEPSFAIEPGDSHTINVAVTKLGWIQGTVKASSGSSTAQSAIPGIEVSATSDRGNFSAITDSNGGFTIAGSASEQGLLAGEWAVYVTIPDGYTTSWVNGRTVSVGNGNKTPLTIILDPKAVNIRIEAWDSTIASTVAGLTVKLQPTSGTPREHLTEGVEGGRHFYEFLDVPPGFYTVQILGENYNPITQGVTVRVNESPQYFTVPIAGRANTVSGTVLGQQGGGVPTAVVGASIKLSTVGRAETVGGEVSSGTTDQAGAFELTNVPDGSYVLEIANTAVYAGTTRYFSVSGGQILALEIVLFTVTHQVVVDINSVNKFNLTGSVVTLSSGNKKLAAQPAVWTGSGSTIYRATFTQVEPGDWTAKVSLPPDRLGFAESALTRTIQVDGERTADSGEVGDDHVQIDIEEVGLALAAVATDGAPTVTVTATQGSTTTAALELIAGAGARTAYLPQDTYTLTATTENGWTVSPATERVEATEKSHSATLFVSKAAGTAPSTSTSTTIDVAPSTKITIGETTNVTLTARVREDTTTAVVTTGTVTFHLGGTWLGTKNLGTDGRATLSLDATALALWPTGTSTITATFNGHGTYYSSDVTTTVKVIRTDAVPIITRTTINVAPSTKITRGATTNVTLTARVREDTTNAVVTTGTVTFHLGGTWLGTKNLGTDGRATLSLDATALALWPTGTSTITATFNGHANYYSSDVTVEVTNESP